MKGRCGFTGCEEAANHTCGNCGMPLCETHVVIERGASGGPTAYCPQCRDYLRAKSGDAPARRVEEGGGSDSGT